MKKHLTEYKKWLEKELYEEMERPKCSQNYRMVGGLLEAINNIDEMMKHNSYPKAEQRSAVAEEKSFTPEMAYDWTSKMQNGNGTVGAHWALEQTTAVAEKFGIVFEHISPEAWFTTMNMYYSDACKALKEYHDMQGFPEPLEENYINFCAVMAKSFLFDVDSVPPMEKLYYYYTYIVKQ